MRSLESHSLGVGRQSGVLLGSPELHLRNMGLFPSARDESERCSCHQSTYAFQNRSYYELDILFERRIPARKFKTSIVEANADEHTREQLHIHTR